MLTEAKRDPICWREDGRGSPARARSGRMQVLSLVYLTLAVLGPWINIGTVRGLRPEEAMLPLMAMVYLSGTGFCLRLPKSLRWVLVGLAGIAACISFSLLANIPRSGGGPVARDTLELVRVGKYALVMILAGYDSATAGACRKWFVVLILVATSIACIQVVAPPEWVFRTMSAIDPNSAKFYAPQNVAAGLRRITATFSNPNNCGVFLSASAGLLIGLLFSARKGGEGWFFGGALIAVAAAVIATQSFTGLLALGLVFLASGTAVVAKRKYRRRALVLFMAVAIVVGIVAGYLGLAGSSSFVLGQRLTTANYALATMAGRVKVWTGVALKMADDPAMLVFGMGPQKESETQVVGGDIDSEYVMILKRYGLVGFLCFGLFLALAVAALLIPMPFETASVQGWRFGALLMMLAILVSDVTNVVYANNQLMDIFMFVLGCVLTRDNSVTERAFGPRSVSSILAGPGTPAARTAVNGATAP
jgi:hypothetical protein